MWVWAADSRRRNFTTNRVTFDIDPAAGTLETLYPFLSNQILQDLTMNLIESTV
jgi:hypothetical protein